MKVFCIGLPRTGTTSLKRALNMLGYKTCSLKDALENEDTAHVGDAICLPIERWKDLVEEYPDAKFILTMRESSEVWFQSVCKRAEKKRSNPGVAEQRERMYGHAWPTEENKQDFISIYEDRIDDILLYFYFKNKLKNILLFCPENGDGWEKLCKFLDKPIPDRKYPHMNKSK
jgi:hypothetical protein